MSPPAALAAAKGKAAAFQDDPLLSVSLAIFDDKAMKECLPSDVYERFKSCVLTGDPTPEADQKVIADALFTWARELGAVDFAHWFFPKRFGSGAVGGMVGALKMDTLIDLHSL
mmetsp:Transcript_255/g.262  ORF Transcript_255/g.262 Transcript_255/m.262 type:complete len:114 (+) Transcript_255:2-343(+)